jgi:hypothetical protein
MKGYLGFAGLLIIFSLGACKKPILEVTSNVVPPMILATALEDTLPSSAVEAMDVRGVTGLKIQYYSGLFTSYFEYDIDKGLLLKTISELPFTHSASLADTLCREIAVTEMAQPWEDLSMTKSDFTLPDLQNKETHIFECLKPPYRHTLVLTKKSNRIHHRIEFLGQS